MHFCFVFAQHDTKTVRHIPQLEGRNEHVETLANNRMIGRDGWRVTDTGRGGALA